VVVGVDGAEQVAVGVVGVVAQDGAGEQRAEVGAVPVPAVAGREEEFLYLQDVQADLARGLETF